MKQSCRRGRGCTSVAIVLIYVSMFQVGLSEAFVHPAFPVRQKDVHASNRYYQSPSLRESLNVPVRRSCNTLTKHSMFSAAVTSILAGSVAGAVGVGVAYPFDSLKTKAQLQQANNMFQTMASVYQQEGIAGFFGGVRAMMLGQAVIKSVAFGTNAFALNCFQQHDFGLSANIALLLAAALSGFITSFLVVPVERIKVMMQAQQKGADNAYANEVECLQAIIKSEGVTGLLGRGLGPTLAREVPSYAIYFCVYGLLMQTPLAASLGKIAPLVFGATAGCACWIPVYPIDSVKTLVQNTEGGAGNALSTWEVAADLYTRGGVAAFFDGLTPKMLRAAVNHAVTFWVYASVLEVMQVPVSKGGLTL